MTQDLHLLNIQPSDTYHNSSHLSYLIGFQDAIHCLATPALLGLRCYCSLRRSIFRAETSRRFVTMVSTVGLMMFVILRNRRRITPGMAQDHSGNGAGFAHERASVDDDSHDIYNGSDLINRYDGSKDRGLVKRILGEEFNCLLDRGWHSLVDGVFEAFHGRNGHPQHPSPKWGKNTFPTPDYGKVEDWLLKQHGWSRRQEDNAKLPDVWKGAFQMMPQGFAGHKEITRLTWTHDQRYSYVLEQRVSPSSCSDACFANYSRNPHLLNTRTCSSREQKQS